MLGLKKFADVHMHIEDNDYEKAHSLFDFVADELGVTDGALLALDNYPPCDRAQLFTSLYFKANYKKIKLRVFGSLYEIDINKDIPFDVQVQKLMDMGCDGIKFINMKPEAYMALGRGINDPIYDSMFALLEKTGFPIMLHAADPEEFWSDSSKMTENQKLAGWWYGDGKFPTYEQIYKEVYEVLDRYPNLNIVMAHFFFLSNNMPEVVRIMEKYKNLRFDLTPGHEMYLGFSKDIKAWREFFQKYSDRILFGTDATTTRSNDITYKKYSLVAQGLAHDESEFPIPRIPDLFVRGLNLDPETIEKIAYKNFIDLVGDTPREVNIEYARSEAEKLLKQARTVEGLERSVELLEEFLDKTK
ncbi:MAG: hypothetical protein E7640_04675 [Ruminococcaceae bacterium]|nr:hypothetical protein [Oscillospiraceae bacterium]